MCVVVKVEVHVDTVVVVLATQDFFTLLNLNAAFVVGCSSSPSVIVITSSDSDGMDEGTPLPEIRIFVVNVTPCAVNTATVSM